jgi:hypothetical protein
LPDRRHTQTDAAQCAGERIIPHVFHDTAGCSLFGADQRPKKFQAGVARSVAMELVLLPQVYPNFLSRMV